MVGLIFMPRIPQQFGEAGSSCDGQASDGAEVLEARVTALEAAARSIRCFVLERSGAWHPVETLGAGSSEAGTSGGPCASGAEVVARDMRARGVLG